LFCRNYACVSLIAIAGNGRVRLILQYFSLYHIDAQALNQPEEQAELYATLYTTHYAIARSLEDAQKEIIGKHYVSGDTMLNQLPFGVTSPRIARGLERVIPPDHVELTQTAKDFGHVERAKYHHAFKVQAAADRHQAHREAVAAFFQCLRSHTAALHLANAAVSAQTGQFTTRDGYHALVQAQARQVFLHKYVQEQIAIVTGDATKEACDITIASLRTVPTATLVGAVQYIDELNQDMVLVRVAAEFADEKCNERMELMPFLPKGDLIIPRRGIFDDELTFDVLEYEYRNAVQFLKDSGEVPASGRLAHPVGDTMAFLRKFLAQDESVPAAVGSSVVAVEAAIAPAEPSTATATSEHVAVDLCRYCDCVMEPDDGTGSTAGPHASTCPRFDPNYKPHENVEEQLALKVAHVQRAHSDVVMPKSTIARRGTILLSEAKQAELKRQQEEAEKEAARLESEAAAAIEAARLEAVAVIAKQEEAVAKKLADEAQAQADRLRELCQNCQSVMELDSTAGPHQWTCPLYDAKYLPSEEMQGLLARKAALALAAAEDEAAAEAATATAAAANVASIITAPEEPASEESGIKSAPVEEGASNATLPNSDFEPVATVASVVLDELDEKLPDPHLQPEPAVDVTPIDPIAAAVANRLWLEQLNAELDVMHETVTTNHGRLVTDPDPSWTYDLSVDLCQHCNAVMEHDSTAGPHAETCPRFDRKYKPSEHVLEHMAKQAAHAIAATGVVMPPSPVMKRATTIINASPLLSSQSASPTNASAKSSPTNAGNRLVSMGVLSLDQVPPTMAGYVLKQSGMLGQWNKRYLVAEGRTLFLRNAQIKLDDDSVKYTWVLAAVTFPPPKKGRFYFTIVDGDPLNGKSIRFAVEEVGQFEAWRDYMNAHLAAHAEHASDNSIGSGAPKRLSRQMSILSLPGGPAAGGAPTRASLSSPSRSTFPLPSLSEDAEFVESDVKYDTAKGSSRNTLLSTMTVTDAVGAYNTAIREEPMNPLHYINRSLAHYAAQAWDKSLDDARAAVKLDPLEVKGHYRMARALMALNCPKEAVVAFETAARLDPQATEIQLYLRSAREAVAQAGGPPADLHPDGPAWGTLAHCDFESLEAAYHQELADLKARLEREERESKEAALAEAVLAQARREQEELAAVLAERERLRKVAADTFEAEKAARLAERADASSRDRELLEKSRLDLRKQSTAAFEAEKAEASAARTASLEAESRASKETAANLRAQASAKFEEEKLAATAARERALKEEATAAEVRREQLRQQAQLAFEVEKADAIAERNRRLQREEEGARQQRLQQRRTSTIQFEALKAEAVLQAQQQREEEEKAHAHARASLRMVAQVNFEAEKAAAMEARAQELAFEESQLQQERQFKRRSSMVAFEAEKALAVAAEQARQEQEAAQLQLERDAIRRRATSEFLASQAELVAEAKERAEAEELVVAEQRRSLRRRSMVMFEAERAAAEAAHEAQLRADIEAEKIATEQYQVRKAAAALVAEQARAEAIADAMLHKRMADKVAHLHPETHHAHKAARQSVAQAVAVEQADQIRRLQDNAKAEADAEHARRTHLRSTVASAVAQEQAAAIADMQRRRAEEAATYAREREAARLQTRSTVDAVLAEHIASHTEAMAKAAADLKAERKVARETISAAVGREQAERTAVRDALLKAEAQAIAHETALHRAEVTKAIEAEQAARVLQARQLQEEEARVKAAEDRLKRERLIIDVDAEREFRIAEHQRREQAHEASAAEERQQNRIRTRRMSIEEQTRLTEVHAILSPTAQERAQVKAVVVDAVEAERAQRLSAIDRDADTVRAAVAQARTQIRAATAKEQAERMHAEQQSIATLSAKSQQERIKSRNSVVQAMDVERASRMRQRAQEQVPCSRALTLFFWSNSRLVPVEWRGFLSISVYSQHCVGKSHQCGFETWFFNFSFEFYAVDAVDVV
jgi:hypothetical protein